jgi:hypothetical protein
MKTRPPLFEIAVALTMEALGISLMDWRFWVAVPALVLTHYITRRL